MLILVILLLLLQICFAFPEDIKKENEAEELSRKGKGNLLINIVFFKIIKIEIFIIFHYSFVLPKFS